MQVWANSQTRQHKHSLTLTPTHPHTSKAKTMKLFMWRLVLPCRTTHMINTSICSLWGQEHNQYCHYLCKDDKVDLCPCYHLTRAEFKHFILCPRGLEPTASAHTSQRIMGKSTWMQGCSSFTIPCRMKHSFRRRHTHAHTVPHLWDQILLDSLQLGLLPAVFGHHRLLVELVGQVSILVIVQGAGDTTRAQKWHVS